MSGADIHADDIMAHAEDVLHTVSGDLAVLMSTNTGKFVELNVVGRTIWELTDGSRSVRMIADALQDKYDVSESDCISQICEFYAGLKAEEMIVEPAKVDG